MSRNKDLLKSQSSDARSSFYNRLYTLISGDITGAIRECCTKSVQKCMNVWDKTRKMPFVQQKVC